MIPIAKPYLTEEDASGVYDVVRLGWITMGEKVAEFEEAFANYVGASHAVAVSTGTAALHLALAAIGVGPGDDVVLPSLTFVSSANAVLYVGANPVLCECDPESFVVTADHLRSKITDRTRAIMPVDMNGLPVDYDSILAVADEFGLSVIADSAESLGARYRDRSVGSIADIHIFSFFANKNVTTGEGGMLTTNHEGVAELLRILRNQGQEGRYNHTHLGFNYRLTDIQAALGITQLKRTDWIVNQKTLIAERYTESFMDSPFIAVPSVPEYVTQHAWYMYAVRVPGADRDSIVIELDKRGIETRLSFPPIHIQPYYRSRFGWKREDLPISASAWSELINLPIWPGLPLDDQHYVITSLLDACEKHQLRGARS